MLNMISPPAVPATRPPVLPAKPHATLPPKQLAKAALEIVEKDVQVLNQTIDEGRADKAKAKLQETSEDMKKQLPLATDIVELNALDEISKSELLDKTEKITQKMSLSIQKLDKKVEQDAKSWKPMNGFMKNLLETQETFKGLIGWELQMGPEKNEEHPVNAYSKRVQVFGVPFPPAPVNQSRANLQIKNNQFDQQLNKFKARGIKTHS